MVAAGMAATMLTRFVPFMVFRPGKPTPKYIMYLGKVLPASVFAMLVVYCLRHTVAVNGASSTAGGLFLFSADALFQYLAVLFTIGVHLWKKNIMLSIVAGTACYMLLIRL